MSFFKKDFTSTLSGFFKGPSFLDFFSSKNILRIQISFTFMVNKKSPRIINQVQLSHLVLVLIPLLIWILVNGKYMNVWFIANYVTILQVWILVRLFCQYINLTGNINQSNKILLYWFMSSFNMFNIDSRLRNYILNSKNGTINRWPWRTFLYT